MLNTYIYHQLPPTCFSVCYTIFRETIVLLAQKSGSMFQLFFIVPLKLRSTLL